MENDNQGNDYALKFLADMEAKYAALGNAIAGVRAALSTGALGALGIAADTQAAPFGGTPSGSASASLPRGAFLGKSINEAIRIYLDAVKTRKGNKEITAALKEGGAVSTGDFYNRINGALFQMKNRGEVLRFDDGWGLAAWYPESFRNRVVEKSSGAPPKRKLAKKKSAQKVEARIVVKPGLDKRVEEALQKEPMRKFTGSDIASMMSLHPNGGSLALGRLAKKGTATKLPDGSYQYKGNVQEMPKAV
jgi:hypothetical protein